MAVSAGTLVATTEGRQAIEKVKVGDRVWAYDLVNSMWRPRRVLQTFQQSYEGHSVFVTVAAQAEETIEATLFHPFWVVRGESLELRPRRKHLPSWIAKGTLLFTIANWAIWRKTHRRSEPKSRRLRNGTEKLPIFSSLRRRIAMSPL